ncbi:MAG: hypothetical protein LPK45_02875, partial [Bacteroidota bacterium]|nr:hypothetical protein [Bacteroidota bacterium]MDX5429983.1 hypothetical protein [Bacteroidota bacterium]MDX5468756.1 hypothetical protein [Bacteroidota bacterium]
MSDQSIQTLIKENKGVLFFLMRFLGVFGGLSIAYAAWIDSFGTKPDTFSWFVARNINFLFGGSLNLYEFPGHPVVSIDYLNKV